MWLESNREWLSNTFGTRSSALSLRQGGSAAATCKSTSSIVDSSKKKRTSQTSDKKNDSQPEPIVGFSNFTLAESKLSLQQPMPALDCLFEVIRRHDQLDLQVLLTKDIATYIQMKMLEAKTRYQIALILLQHPQILLSKRSTPLLAIHRNNAGSCCSAFFEMSSIHQALAELEYCHAIQLNCKYLWQQNETMLSYKCNQQPDTYDNLLKDYQATCEQLAKLQFRRQNYVEAVVKYNEAKDVLVYRLEKTPQGQAKEELILELARLWFHLGTLHYKSKHFMQARDAYEASLKLYYSGPTLQFLTEQDEIHIKQMKHRTGMKSNMYASCSMTYWMDKNSV